MERAQASLADLIDRSYGPVADAARLVGEICEGLAALHNAGWVHGDLKPDNVLIMADGSVRLGDFGLAGELDGTHAYLPPLGSSDYMPPERWTERLGERGVAVRTSSDIWALGVIAYQLFTGDLPFPGLGARARAGAANRYAEGREPLRIPLGVPDPWRRVIEGCLAPTHTRRQVHDAAAVLARIRALDPGVRATARQPGTGRDRGGTGADRRRS